MVYQKFYDWLDKAGHQNWRVQLQTQVAAKLHPERHGKMPMWQQALADLPAIRPSVIELHDKVQIGIAEDLQNFSPATLTALLKQFHPWRKGPYNLFGIYIDTEWHSDWKWDRVLPHIKSLENRVVLDVGGGNGYHGWRMVGEGARMVMGIDPTWVFAMQYQVMQHFIQSERHFVLPIGIEHMPSDLQLFDTVFSMGVLYHRRSPLTHLMECRQCLKPGGELVLETLVIEGEQGMTLMPEQRYAKMNNVWFIPSVPTMELWLRKCGYKNVRCVNVANTTVEEQRATDWMTFESLADFLDPQDNSKTIEGYPGPRRAIFIADAPQ